MRQYTWSKRMRMAPMLVKEAIPLFETCKLVGNDARKYGPQHRAGYVSLYQSANVQIDVVDGLIDLSQSIHHRFFHDS